MANTPAESYDFGVEDPLVGAVLQDRYRIKRRIAEGGMGVVYEGEHVMIGRRVAIKTLHAHNARHPDAIARLQQEAIAATAVGNEHVVEVTDMGRLRDGTAFLVLEYLEGQDLSDALGKHGPLPVARVCHIVSQLCEALAAVHAREIIHRDLKPENIFLVRRGDDPDFVKIVDFGISKIRDGTMTASSRTRTGHTLGTPWFMAPEQIEGRKDLDYRVDIYAVGVILYNALTDRLPFEQDSLPQLALAICTHPPPDVRTLRPDVPEGLAKLIARLLSKRRVDRPQDCNEVKQALQPYAYAGMHSRSIAPPAVIEYNGTPNKTGLLNGSVPEVPAPARAGQRLLQRTHILVLVALSTFALVLGVAFGLRSRPQRTQESPRQNTTAPIATATLHIETIPPGATVFVDGVSRGTAPIDQSLPSGRTYRVQARWDAATTTTQELSLRANLHAVLQAPVAPPPVVTVPSSDPQPTRVAPRVRVPRPVAGARTEGTNEPAPPAQTQPTPSVAPPTPPAPPVQPPSNGTPQHSGTPIPREIIE